MLAALKGLRYAFRITREGSKLRTRSAGVRYTHP
jgi:hypothetical protein